MFVCFRVYIKKKKLRICNGYGTVKDGSTVCVYIVSDCSKYEVERRCGVGIQLESIRSFVGVILHWTPLLIKSSI